MVDGRLFVAPGCGHEVMSRKPALFNEALAGFFRSTATVAERRAATAHDQPGATAVLRRPTTSSARNPLSEARPTESGSDSDWLHDTTPPSEPQPGGTR
jgi:hypothetical protein